jgi:FlaA1/EpsC-like NDP-sugar epimerase
MNIIFKQLFNLKTGQKRSILFVADCAIVIMALLLAVIVLSEDSYSVFKIDSYLAVLAALIVNACVLYVRGLYNTVNRHVTFDTAATVIIASNVSAFTIYLIYLLLDLNLPSFLPLIYAAFSCLGIGSIRFFIRAIGQKLNQTNKEHIAIYGAGAAGRQLVEALKWNSAYNVCQLIDDDTALHGQRISGLKVESFDAAQKRFSDQDIRTVFLAMPSVSPTIYQHILDRLSDCFVAVKVVPDIFSLAKGKAAITDFRDIEIEELLGRQAVQPNANLMQKNIFGKAVLVTGAGGSIGSELCRQVVTLEPSKLILMDVSEFSIYALLEELLNKKLNVQIVPIIGSIQNKLLVKKTMSTFSIDTVFHAAAYKHVPLMEQNVMECITNNVLGTLNVANSAIEAEVTSFTLVSTDKAVNPTNFMGASKRIGELLCQEMSKGQKKTNFSIVRFGNVLGSSGSVVPLFRKQIATGGPLTVTHRNVVRYFMTITEAAQLVVQASSIGKNGDILVLDMGAPIKLVDLARKMITLAGKQAVFSQDVPLRANQIYIKFVGLRAGEKMYEELTYGTNLTKTIHTRIMKADDELTYVTDLNLTIAKLKEAITTDNYKDLFLIVESFCEHVSTTDTSVDSFFNNTLD